MKIAIRILIVLILFGAGWWGWTRYSADSTPSVPTTAKVALGSVEQTVLASGQIEAQTLISVGARVSGQIETLAVSLGQEVRAGDLIAQIDSQDQENEVLQAKAALANIEAQIAAKQANLKKAELTLERQARLQKQSYTSQEDLETAQADVDVYKADLAALAAQKSSAEVTVSTAQIALDRTRITAPIDGTVVAVVVKQGQTVNAVQNAPTIVKIANLDKMVVKAEISEADVVHVKPGQDVSFTILGEPDHAFHATVREVEPAPSEIESSDTISTDEAIYFNGLLEVDNPDHLLRIGMTAQVSIVLARAENVLTVPAAALSKGAGGMTVQVWDPKTATRETRAVEVGLDDKVTAEIRSGLSAGEEVVTGTRLAAGTSSASSNRMRPPMGF